MACVFQVGKENLHLLKLYKHEIHRDFSSSMNFFLIHLKMKSHFQVFHIYHAMLQFQAYIEYQARDFKYKYKFQV